MVDVKLVLAHFYFYLNAIFITLRPNRDTQYKFCKNRFFNAFFSLPHTCHFQTRPSPVSKIGGNAVGAQFLQLITTKTSKVAPIFYCLILIRTVLRFNRKNIDFFLAILQNRLD